jgi:4-alpha-glucanotransferase
VAPSRCFTIEDAWMHLHPDATSAPPLWGVAAQVYGLRRNGDGGVGDYTALATLAAESARRNSHAVAISPMHAMFSAEPHKFSPYSPSSRLFLNIAHIDPASVFGAQAAKAAIEAAGVADELAALEALSLIDWPRVVKAKLAVLRALFEGFGSAEHASLHKDFAHFVKRGGRALEDHARFEALQAEQLKTSGEGHWRNWPDELRDPRSEAVAAFGAAHKHEVDFFLFAQWLAAKGLSHAQHVAREAGMAIGLIADLAVGCDSAGSHAWSYRDEMLTGVSVGAPPDLFNQKGQSWGLTTFSPRAMRTQGFSAFIDMLRAAFTLAGGIRIDHILGLRRLWLVPDGESAKDGAYLRYPLDDLLRLIALESWRHKAIVIGEDLGTVPPSFRARCRDAGIAGMDVLWFQRERERFLAPNEWRADAVGMTTTHDLPTVAGWWRGADLELRRGIGTVEESEIAQRPAERMALWQAFTDADVATGTPPPADDTDPVVDAATEFVAQAPGPLAIVPLEDIMGAVEQPNLPGTTDQHPNWRRRFHLPVDEMLRHPAAEKRLGLLKARRSS